jgi:SH3 domain protein
VLSYSSLTGVSTEIVVTMKHMSSKNLGMWSRFALVLVVFALLSPGVSAQNLEARLEKSEEQRKQQAQEIKTLTRERKEMQRQLDQLEKYGQGLRQELDDVRRLSADVVLVDEQNQELRQKLAQSQRTIEELRSGSQNLASRSNREWFVIGALVVLFGILIGLILPRIRWRRKSGWGEL